MMSIVQINQTLEEEINRINEQLIDSHVEIDVDGIQAMAADGRTCVVVICSYNAVSLNPANPFQDGSFRVVSSHLVPNVKIFCKIYIFILFKLHFNA
jgi:hypothetical protein